MEGTGNDKIGSKPLFGLLVALVVTVVMLRLRRQCVWGRWRVKDDCLRGDDPTTKLTFRDGVNETPKTLAHIIMFTYKGEKKAEEKEEEERSNMPLITYQLNISPWPGKVVDCRCHGCQVSGVSGGACKRQIIQRSC
jgi:hypothetical protein